MRAHLPGARRPFVLGICGAQGSGKSTLAAALVPLFGAAGLPAATLSLDDLYLTRRERAKLAREVHPLFATRGVPGTHDLGLAFGVLDALANRRAAPLPRFDKARDDRAESARWDVAPPDTAILILEGWLVGARPQATAELLAPVNALERDEDVDGTWRRSANAALAGDYQRLFARLDLLVLLAAPDFASVGRWRAEVEHGLRAATGAGMSDAEIGRFVKHYERLTRHILGEMPERADMVVRLAPDRTTREITLRPPPDRL